MRFFGIPEGKRPRRRWEDNINIDLQVLGLGGMDCVILAQDRYNFCECGNEPWGFIKFREFLE